ncbi:hypothetical protein QTI66_32710 [Variovorax sp. J22R133]|uniref:hypothetical protein n=1 Tax=Variovorax brevis TaxID=3053503 RepID=UPI002576D179|nr:hypothetical protein [Variovorax sp. J22R133]MDM0116890.1 hypothetical protein [Variovorax sp. J22R133]
MIQIPILAGTDFWQRYARERAKEKREQELWNDFVYPLDEVRKDAQKGMPAAKVLLADFETYKAYRRLTQ